MIELTKNIVLDIDEPIRLLDYVIDNISNIISRNGAKKAIKKGSITLDGEIVESGRFLKAGQEVIHWDLEEEKKIFPLTLDVLFEDDYLAIVHKPAGIGTNGNYFRTVENALPFNLSPSKEPHALKYPQTVHRLDNPTSGLIVAAKTQKTRIALGEMFAQGKVHKTYHAIVHGDLYGKSELDYPIDDKEALSEYESLNVYASDKFAYFSLVKLIPITGRTHQLRIHLSKNGFPIIGDPLYVSSDPFKGKGLFLSSTGIAFNHPVTNEALSYNIELPNKFTAFIKRYKQD